MNRLGIGFWPDVFAAKEMLKYSIDAEGKGYDSVWIAEHYLFRDAFSTLAAIALQTKRMKLATGVVNPYTRHPALIAMSIATIDELSGGRAILGIGSGVSLWIKQQMAMKMDGPLSVTKEAIEIVKGILAGEEFSYLGQKFTLRGMKLGFKTIQERIPVYMAAVGQNALKLAGEIADGVILTAGCSPRYVADAVKIIRMGARNAGRDPSKIDVAAFLICSVSEDSKAAKDRTRELVAFLLARPGRAELMLSEEGMDQKALYLVKREVQKGKLREAGRHVTEAMINSMAVAGTSAECRRMIQKYVEAEATLPVLMLLDPSDRAVSSTLDLI